MKDDYASSPTHLAEELGVPLLGHIVPESRYLERHGHLGAFAPDPMLSSHIYHAIQERMKSPGRTPVLWIAFLPDSWEQAPCGVGLAEAASAAQGRCVLAEVGDVHLPNPEGAPEPLDPSMKSLVQSIMERPVQFWGSDVAGVVRSLPVPDAPLLPGDAMTGTASHGTDPLLLLAPLGDDEAQWIPSPLRIDGVILVAAFRDHPQPLIAWAVERIRGSGHTFLGLVAAGPAEAPAEEPSFDAEETSDLYGEGPGLPPPLELRTYERAPVSAVPEEPATVFDDLERDLDDEPEEDLDEEIEEDLDEEIEEDFEEEPFRDRVLPTSYRHAIKEEPRWQEAPHREIPPPPPPPPPPLPRTTRDVAAPRPGAPPSPVKERPQRKEEEVKVTWASRFGTETARKGILLRRLKSLLPWLALLLLIFAFGYWKLGPTLRSKQGEGGPRESTAHEEAGDGLDPAGKAPARAPGAVPTDPIGPDAPPVEESEPGSGGSGEDGSGGAAAGSRDAAQPALGDSLARPTGSGPTSSFPALEPWVPSILWVEDTAPAGGDGASLDESPHRAGDPASEGADPPDREASEEDGEGNRAADGEGGTEGDATQRDATQGNERGEEAILPLSVQVGAFRVPERIFQEIERLAALGVETDTVWVTIPHRGRWCRILAGTFEEPAQAESLMAAMKRHPRIRAAHIVTRGGRGGVWFPPSGRNDGSSGPKN